MNLRFSMFPGDFTDWPSKIAKSKVVFPQARQTRSKVEPMLVRISIEKHGVSL